MTTVQVTVDLEEVLNSADADEILDNMDEHDIASWIDDHQDVLQRCDIKLLQQLAIEHIESATLTQIGAILAACFARLPDTITRST